MGIESKGGAQENRLGSIKVGPRDKNYKMLKAELNETKTAAEAD